jgi:hypothetical protein
MKDPLVDITSYVPSTSTQRAWDEVARLRDDTIFVYVGGIASREDNSAGTNGCTSTSGTDRSSCPVCRSYFYSTDNKGSDGDHR